MRSLRSTVLATVAVSVGIAAFAVTPASAATSPRPSSWAQAGYNAAHSNANLAETGLGAAEIGTLTEAFHLSGGSRGDHDCAAGVGPTAFSQNRVYAIVDGSLVARNLNTGHVLYKRPLNKDQFGVFTSIAVSHGLVLVGEDNGCENNDPEGAITAYTASTGKQAWSANLGGGNLQDMSVSGTYVVGTFGCFYCTEQLGVFNVYDGSTVWSADSKLTETSSALVVDDKVFLPIKEKGADVLQSYDLATGEKSWTLPSGYSVIAGDTDALTSYNLLAHDSSGQIVDLDPRTGRTRFALPKINGFETPVVLDDYRIYSVCGNSGSAVCAFKESTGALIWQHSPGGISNGKGIDQFVEADGLLYVDSGLVLKTSNGTQVGTLQNSPSLVGSGHIGMYDDEDTNRRFDVLTSAS